MRTHAQMLPIWPQELHRELFGFDIVVGDAALIDAVTNPRWDLSGTLLRSAELPQPWDTQLRACSLCSQVDVSGSSAGVARRRGGYRWVCTLRSRDFRRVPARGGCLSRYHNAPPQQPPYKCHVSHPQQQTYAGVPYCVAQDYSASHEDSQARSQDTPDAAHDSPSPSKAAHGSPSMGLEQLSLTPDDVLTNVCLLATLPE